MDGWQAVQNWAVFCVLLGGLAFYYTQKGKVAKPAPLVKEPKKEARKPTKKVDKIKSVLVSEGDSDAPEQSLPSKAAATQNTTKKRKGNTQPKTQAADTPAAAQDDGDDEIDMSTRQFAANMQKARDGIQVKSTGNNNARVRTVKPKNSPTDTPVLSSASSHAGDEWSSALSPALGSAGIDDMLEPVAPGPSSLRITASEKPVREKVNKQTKKEVVETKKQRQNRRKNELKSQENQATAAMQNQLKEQQRRTAREAEGRPARNGIPVASVPSQWAERNGAKDAHLPVVDNSGHNVQLLDTLDTESNSSSNQETSTAATSVAAESAPSRFAEDDEIAKAMEESKRDSGWSEVKPSKKGKKNNVQAESDGASTPVAAPTRAAPAVNKQYGVTKSNGYQALMDEGEQNGEFNTGLSSNWEA